MNTLRLVVVRKIVADRVIPLQLVPGIKANFMFDPVDQPWMVMSCAEPAWIGEPVSTVIRAKRVGERGADSNFDSLYRLQEVRAELAVEIRHIDDILEASAR